jgi:cytochrome c oxidase cbb3-type subunit I/II
MVAKSVKVYTRSWQSEAPGLLWTSDGAGAYTIEEVEGVRPYTPLEQRGRDLYVREGCYTCHSQMIRTLVPDVLRYGRAGVAADYSRLGESIYDRPFQWGSRRIGPDLARVGGNYNHAWHYRHMEDPRQTSPGSNMPAYPWLLTADTDVGTLPAKLRVQRQLGVPYPEMTPEAIQARVDAQAREIVADLAASGIEVAPEREIIALIAYLQYLGSYEEVTTTADDLAHQTR